MAADNSGTPGATTPRQDQRSVAATAEFVICDHTIEDSFRDDKSGGFDLDASHLTDPKRLDALLLALAIAVLWVYELGAKVLSNKQRRTIAPGYKRQRSVFQLGWRHLHRALSCNLPRTFSLALHPFRPEPVQNSVS